MHRCLIALFVFGTATIVTGQPAVPPPLELTAELAPASGTGDAAKRDLARGAAEVLRRRLTEFGYEKAAVDLQGDGRLRIHVPDPELEEVPVVRSMIETVGDAEVAVQASRAVRGLYTSPARGTPEGYAWVELKGGGRVLVESAARWPPDRFASANGVETGDLWTPWNLRVALDERAGRTLRSIVTSRAGVTLILFADGKVFRTADVRKPPEDGAVVFPGPFTEREARGLAVILASGRLPCPVRILDAPAGQKSEPVPAKPEKSAKR